MSEELYTEEHVIHMLYDAVRESGNHKKFARDHHFSTSLLYSTLGCRLPLGPAVLNSLGLEKITLYKCKGK